MSEDAPITRLNEALAGRYHVVRRIGEGGMATVYLAHDAKHDRDVALKVLRTELAEAVGPERFLSEIRITANLQHPHILPLFDSGTAGSALYYVMPLVEGETLRSRLDREGRLGIEEGVRIVQSVAAALHHAHERGVVHRDIKPENVMLSAGLPLVLDFGIAGAVETAGADPVSPWTGQGTPGYMSPEQAMAGAVDGRSDVYALGSLLYEVLTGETPYPGRTRRAVLARVLMEPVPSVRRLREQITPELDSVMRRALAKDPRNRFATAGAMATALGGRSTRRPEGMPEIPDRSDALAVLPFENLSDDPRDPYFSDGVTDDVIAAVGRIDGVRVMSRTSVTRYREARAPATEIARELGVGAVIDGSVRRSGDRARIVVQLVDARSGALHWAGTYDRSVEDIFRVQSEVAAEVARAVEQTLSRAARENIEGRGTRDVEAYDLYLRGRHRWAERLESSVVESLSYFGFALERDPDFALAHAAIAEANAILGIYGARRASEAMESARAAAERALEIDPTLGEAWASLACVHTAYDRDWAAGEAGFRRALESAPSYATGHHWLAMNLLTPSRRFTEAVAELERAEELDPHSDAVASSRGIVAFYERDYGQAVRELESATRDHPGFGLGHCFLGRSWEALGRGDRALESLERAVALSTESSEMLAALGHCHAAAGRTGEAEEIARRLENRARLRYVSPALRAHIQLGWGNEEAALDLLEAAAAVRATDLVWLAVQPAYDPLRDEPRFRALVDWMGIPV